MLNEPPINPPVLLAKEHDCSAFDCGVDELNRFLQRYASQNQRRNAARTYVATRGAQVVGYYSLAYGSISPSDATPKVMKGLAQYPVPIILLARLAVDRNAQGIGLGKALLKDAILKALNAAEIAGLRALLIHAKDEAAKRFYERYGFEASPTHPNHLMLTINDLQESIK